MNLRKLLLLTVVLSFLLGAAGGWIGVSGFGVPFYFGFFLGFTLAGLSGLFAMAAHADGTQNKR